MTTLAAMAGPAQNATRPLWTAAMLSVAAHALLLAALGSIVSSAWRSTEVAFVPGSGAPLQAWLVPRAAEPEAEPPPPEPPVEKVPAPAPPPAAQTVPLAPAPPAPMPPGLTQPAGGEASVPRSPPPPPADLGNIAVGPTSDLSPFGAATKSRLAALYPVKPGRLPRLKRTLTVVYPDWGLRDGSSAHINALLLLDAQGKVAETIVEPDDPIFAPVVREALTEAEFHPAQAADAPMPYWIALEFVFTIDPLKPAARP
jgi:hypothetical protein